MAIAFTDRGRALTLSPENSLPRSLRKEVSVTLRSERSEEQRLPHLARQGAELSVQQSVATPSIFQHKPGVCHLTAQVEKRSLPRKSAKDAKRKQLIMEDTMQLCDVVRETGFAIHCYHTHGHLEKV